MEESLCIAIRAHDIITVQHKAFARIVEPYLLFESRAGDVVLHGRQIGGDWDETPPPDWCNLKVEEIYSISPTGDTYGKPHPDFNPESKQFFRVICQA